MSNASVTPGPPATTSRYHIITIRPTVSLEAKPIVVPILSCVFGFPVLALAVICALRYRAKRARKRSQMQRIQAVSCMINTSLNTGAWHGQIEPTRDRWRNQDELRSTYSVQDIQEEACLARLVIPGDPIALLEGRALPIMEARPPGPRRGKGGPSTSKEQNGKFLRVPGPQACDLDILAEHSEVDFEYTEVDII